MTNIIPLNPESERLNSEDALKSAIRQQLAAAIGAFGSEQTQDKHVTFALARLHEATDLIQVFYQLRSIR